MIFDLLFFSIGWLITLFFSVSLASQDIVALTHTWSGSVAAVLFVVLVFILQVLFPSFIRNGQRNSLRPLGFATIFIIVTLAVMIVAFDWGKIPLFSYGWNSMKQLWAAVFSTWNATLAYFKKGSSPVNKASTAFAKSTKSVLNKVEETAAPEYEKFSKYMAKSSDKIDNKVDKAVDKAVDKVASYFSSPKSKPVDNNKLDSWLGEIEPLKEDTEWWMK